MDSSMKDNVVLFGDFSMRVYDEVDGERKLVRKFTKRNQITNQGREALLMLMRPDDEDVSLQNKIWSLAVGINSAPPTINDSDTTMDVVWKSALSYVGGECNIVAVPPNDFYLAISKILPTTDAVGSTIVEAGIFTRGDNNDVDLAVGKKLYARQKFSPIIKTSTMTVQFDWQLGITIQS